MAEKRYSIELRQIDVKGLNARHYFWVLKDPDGNVIEEFHGQPVNPKTGRPKSFSLGGDRLGFYQYKGGRGFHQQSKSLPFMTAARGSREEMLRRWEAGRQMGGFMNKTGTKYDPLGDNSNAMATTVGRVMGFDPGKVLDPRPQAGEIQSFTPGLGRDFGPRHPDAPWSPFQTEVKEVKGFGKISPRRDGTPRELSPLADPFRDDIPR